MSEAAARREVVEMVDYMRDTLREFDRHIIDMKTQLAEWQERRDAMAARLSAIEAASDPDVQAAAEDYERRVAEQRPYEGAESADTLLSEAHSRYGK